MPMMIAPAMATISNVTKIVIPMMPPALHPRPSSCDDTPSGPSVTREVYEVINVDVDVFICDVDVDVLMSNDVELKIELDVDV